MIARILDLLYPALCELCQKTLKNGQALCPSCSLKLPRIQEPFCKNCGEMFEGNINDDFHCPNCLGSTHDFHFARAALKGNGSTFHLVHQLKYRRRFFLAPDLALLMDEAMEEDPRFAELAAHSDPPILVSVPLHWKRQQSRQGNQADELARAIAKIRDLPYLKALKRSRATQTQTKLNRKRRLSNLRGAFQIRHKALPQLRGRNIILIDDVFTTGATAHECTRILKHEGKASKVAILSLLRG